MRVSSVARLASCRRCVRWTSVFVEQDLSDVAVNSEINGESSRYQKKVDYFRKYRSETKDRRRVYRRDYYVRNKDSETKYFREFYLRNKDTVAESSRCYNAQDLHRKRKWNQDHYVRNQTRRKAMNKLYYIQNKNDPDSYVSRNADNKSWKTPELVREYFETIGKELHIADHTDWYRISRVQLNQLGGASLFKRFANLGQALQVAYPEFDWDLSKFSLRGKKSGQRWLRMKIEELLPGVEILEEYHHPDLIWADTNRRVELDFWIPKHKIGIEYQGEHHYFNVDSANGPSGTASLYSERDLSKISLCQSLGISLIVIPYWWDESIASLSATLYRARPDVFPVSTGAPIPTEMPSTQIASLLTEPRTRTNLE